jgi:ParB/RepB/Spo0J family partition protein
MQSLPEAAPVHPARPIATQPKADLARWDDIVRSPLNPRKTFDAAGIDDLAGEIRRDGLLNPITVRETSRDITQRYEIVAGERRHRAIEKLIAEGVFPEDAMWPVQVVDFDDRRALLAAVAENMARKDLTEWEQAEAFHKLTTMGVSPAEIAKGSDFGERAIQKRVKLVTQLIPDGQRALREGTLGVEMANVIAAAAEDKQATLLDAALSGLLDTDKLKRLATDKLIPVGAQCFALADYKGEFVEHDSGDGAPQRWFKDTLAVERLVKAYIDNAKGRLTQKDGYAFVEIRKSWQHDVLPDGWTQAPENKRNAAQGALIYVDHNNAKVTIVERVTKPKPAAAPANPDEPGLPFAPGAGAPAPTKGAPAKATAPEFDFPFLNYVADQAGRAVALAMAERPLIAFDAMLARLIAEAMDEAQDEDLQEALAKRLGKAASLREDQLRRHVALLPMAERMALAAIAFYAIDGTPGAVTRELNQPPMLRAEHASLVKALDADIAKHWEFYGDAADDFLAACGPAQLARIAKDLGISTAEDPTEAGLRFTIQGQVARHRKYLPPWLQLQPAAKTTTAIVDGWREGKASPGEVSPKAAKSKAGPPSHVVTAAKAIVKAPAAAKAKATKPAAKTPAAKTKTKPAKKQPTKKGK